MSGLKPECTVCLQPWGNHQQGKHIPKDCKFCQQQAPGDTTTDNLEPMKDEDVHSRPTHITQENQVIKAQLSQLTELVWQLLPQPGQATLQPVGPGNSQALSLPAVNQAASTTRAEVSLPPPSWVHTRDPGVSPGDHKLLLPTHAGQHIVLPPSVPLPAAPATLSSPARQEATTEAQLQQP